MSQFNQIKLAASFIVIALFTAFISSLFVQNGAIYLYVGYVFAALLSYCCCYFLLIRPLITLSERVTSSSDLLKLERETDADELTSKLVAGLTGLKKQLSGDLASIARLGPMAEELKDTYGSMAQKASMQNSHSEMMSASMMQMKEATEQVFNHVEEVRSAVTNGDTQVIESRSVVEATVGSIHQLSSHIEDASKEIQSLQKDSEKIGSIIEVINGIAEQTNLLALNEIGRASCRERVYAPV